MSFRFVISSAPASLQAISPDVTVEAEYGSVCVEGRLLTLAHHGERSGNPCPCLCENRPDLGDLAEVDDVVVGLSHLDLDSMGGIMAVCNRKPRWTAFWKAAAEVDVSGPHKLEAILASIELEYVRNETRDALHAYWAWSEANKVFAPRDGRGEDITDKVEKAMDILKLLVSNDEELYNEECVMRNRLIADGKRWARSKAQLDKDSMYRDYGAIKLRNSDSFVNHLYGDGACVVAYNTKFNSITVSLADPVDGVSCCSVVQDLWGPEAGGHAGIAGSPRGRKMEMYHAIELVHKMQDMLEGQYECMYCQKRIKEDLVYCTRLCADKAASAAFNYEM